MTAKEIAGYIGAAISIALGVALLWFPPAQLANQTGTIALATTFIVGGLGAVGVAVAVPAATAAAVRHAEAMRAAAVVRKPRTRKPRAAAPVAPPPEA